MPMEKAEILF